MSFPAHRRLHLRMSFQLEAAEEFMAAHARILDRRRLELRMGTVDPSAAIAALDGYHNPDGGYGWGSSPTCAPRRASPAPRSTPSRSSKTSPPPLRRKP